MEECRIVKECRGFRKKIEDRFKETIKDYNYIMKFDINNEIKICGVKNINKNDDVDVIIIDKNKRFILDKIFLYIYNNFKFIPYFNIIEYSRDDFIKHNGTVPFTCFTERYEGVSLGSKIYYDTDAKIDQVMKIYECISLTLDKYIDIIEFDKTGLEKDIEELKENFDINKVGNYFYTMSENKSKYNKFIKIFFLNFFPYYILNLYNRFMFNTDDYSLSIVYNNFYDDYYIFKCDLIVNFSIDINKLISENNFKEDDNASYYIKSKNNKLILGPSYLHNTFDKLEKYNSIILDEIHKCINEKDYDYSCLKQYIKEIIKFETYTIPGDDDSLDLNINNKKEFRILGMELTKLNPIFLDLIEDKENIEEYKKYLVILGKEILKQYKSIVTMKIDLKLSQPNINDYFDYKEVYLNYIIPLVYFYAYSNHKKYEFKSFNEKKIVSILMNKYRFELPFTKEEVEYNEKNKKLMENFAKRIISKKKDIGIYKDKIKYNKEDIEKHPYPSKDFDTDIKYKSIEEKNLINIYLLKIVKELLNQCDDIRTVNYYDLDDEITLEDFHNKKFKPVMLDCIYKNEEFNAEELALQFIDNYIDSLITEDCKLKAENAKNYANMLISISSNKNTTFLNAIDRILTLEDTSIEIDKKQLKYKEYLGKFGESLFQKLNDKFGEIKWTSFDSINKETEYEKYIEKTIWNVLNKRNDFDEKDVAMSIVNDLIMMTTENYCDKNTAIKILKYTEINKMINVANRIIISINPDDVDTNLSYKNRKKFSDYMKRTAKEIMMICNPDYNIEDEEEIKLESDDEKEDKVKEKDKKETQLKETCKEDEVDPNVKPDEKCDNFEDRIKNQFFPVDKNEIMKFDKMK